MIWTESCSSDGELSIITITALVKCQKRKPFYRTASSSTKIVSDSAAIGGKTRIGGLWSRGPGRPSSGSSSSSGSQISPASADATHLSGSYKVTMSFVACAFLNFEFLPVCRRFLGTRSFFIWKRALIFCSSTAYAAAENSGASSAVDN